MLSENMFLNYCFYHCAQQLLALQAQFTHVFPVVLLFCAASPLVERLLLLARVLRVKVPQFAWAVRSLLVPSLGPHDAVLLPSQHSGDGMVRCRLPVLVAGRHFQLGS